MLFEPTDLFVSGNKGKEVFNLPDGQVMLVDHFFNKSESDDYYEKLLAQTPWREYQMPMYDKMVTAPRMIAWFEDTTGLENPVASPFTPELMNIRSRVEGQTQLRFNAVLLNLYRNGKDGVAWHSDKTGKSGPDPVIASVTFGETRLFRLRHKTRKDIPVVEIPLHHGSFLLMSGTTNSFWEHQVPKTARDILPRINLTFRQVIR